MIVRAKFHLPSIPILQTTDLAFGTTLVAKCCKYLAKKNRAAREIVEVVPSKLPGQTSIAKLKCFETKHYFAGYLYL